MDGSDTMVEGLENDPFDAAFLAMPTGSPVSAAVERRVLAFGQGAERLAARAFETVDGSLAHMAAHRRARPLLLLGALASSPLIALALLVGLGAGASLATSGAPTKTFPKLLAAEVAAATVATGNAHEPTVLTAPRVVSAPILAPTAAPSEEAPSEAAPSEEAVGPTLEPTAAVPETTFDAPEPSTPHARPARRARARRTGRRTRRAHRPAHRARRSRSTLPRRVPTRS